MSPKPEVHSYEQRWVRVVTIFDALSFKISDRRCHRSVEVPVASSVCRLRRCGHFGRRETDIGEWEARNRYRRSCSEIEITPSISLVRNSPHAATMRNHQGGDVRALDSQTSSTTATSFQYHEYGRRTGLKIRSSQGGVGSSPTFGTLRRSARPLIPSRLVSSKRPDVENPDDSLFKVGLEEDSERAGDTIRTSASLDSLARNGSACRSRRKRSAAKRLSGSRRRPIVAMKRGNGRSGRRGPKGVPRCGRGLESSEDTVPHERVLHTAKRTGRVRDSDVPQRDEPGALTCTRRDRGSPRESLGRTGPFIGPAGWFVGEADPRVRYGVRFFVGLVLADSARAFRDRRGRLLPQANS